MLIVIDIEEIVEFVKDKKVIVVGNNDTIVQKDNSELIDSFDVVVRLNHATPQPNLGKKTDIWGFFYKAVDCQYSEYLKFNPKYMIRGCNLIDSRLEDKYSLIKIPSERLKKHFGEDIPSSGMLVVSFLSFYTKASIYLIGFDFFKTKTFYNTIKIAQRWHNGYKEKEWVNIMIQENKNIEIIGNSDE